MSFVKKGFDELTGKASAKRGQERARRDIVAGQKQAVGALGEGYDEAQSYYDPYMEAGGNAFQNLNAMTFGGDYDVSQTPGFQWRMDQLGKNMNRQLGARGRSNSTFGVNAMSDAYQNLLGDEFNQQYGRVGNIANQGYGAAQAKSNLASGQGANLSNLYTGGGASMAQNSMQGGQIGSQFSPMNQLTSMFSAGTSLAKPFMGNAPNAMAGNIQGNQLPGAGNGMTWSPRR